MINILGLIKKNKLKDSFVFINTTFLFFNQNNILKINFLNFFLFTMQLVKQKNTTIPNMLEDLGFFQLSLFFQTKGAGGVRRRA